MGGFDDGDSGRWQRHLGRYVGGLWKALQLISEDRKSLFMWRGEDPGHVNLAPIKEILGYIYPSGLSPYPTGAVQRHRPPAGFSLAPHL